jgi:phosphoglycolate phosphatase-like HAD superfamily hydrolase
VDAGRTSADDRVAKRRLIEAAGLDGPGAVVGDTEADMGAARALGLAAVGVSTGLRNRGVLLAAGAGTVVDRLARVPAAVDGATGRRRAG